jgi:hypothetical protein
MIDVFRLFMSTQPRHIVTKIEKILELITNLCKEKKNTYIYLGK